MGRFSVFLFFVYTITSYFCKLLKFYTYFSHTRIYPVTIIRIDNKFYFDIFYSN